MKNILKELRVLRNLKLFGIIGSCMGRSLHVKCAEFRIHTIYKSLNSLLTKAERWEYICAIYYVSSISFLILILFKNCLTLGTFYCRVMHTH